MTRADFVRQLVDTEARIGIAGLEEAYDEPHTVPAGAREPTLRAAVPRARHDRPVTVRTARLADPDPRVRAAATVPRRRRVTPGAVHPPTPPAVAVEPCPSGAFRARPGHGSWIPT
ncbi:hypothetical protein [Streptomyces sp. NPDC088847]|uniref:hypothetical protein n=1 Tax=Streptomyces sp. NPDC088847 TaxID=3365909 RepID=UPI00381E3DBC